MFYYTLTPVSLPETEHLVSDEYLVEHHLALIRVTPTESDWFYRIPGKQYLCPALSIDGPWLIQETTDGQKIDAQPGSYELISDPLGLLSAEATKKESWMKQERNLTEFKQLYPELCKKGHPEILLPSGRTRYEETIYTLFQKKLGDTLGNTDDILSLLNECLIECRDYIELSKRLLLSL